MKPCIVIAADPDDLAHNLDQTLANFDEAHNFHIKACGSCGV